MRGLAAKRPRRRRRLAHGRHRRPTSKRRAVSGGSAAREGADTEPSYDRVTYWVAGRTPSLRLCRNAFRVFYDRVCSLRLAVAWVWPLRGQGAVGATASRPLAAVGLQLRCKSGSAAHCQHFGWQPWPRSGAAKPPSTLRRPKVDVFVWLHLPKVPTIQSNCEHRCQACVVRCPVL